MFAPTFFHKSWKNDSSAEKYIFPFAVYFSTVFCYNHFGFIYDYDFGSTTTLKITVMDTGFFRPRQRNAVRLLARNEDYVFECRDCGQPADYVNAECFDYLENPFICEACAEKQRQRAENGEDEDEPDDEQRYDPDMLLPIVNSPRMGVCGYEGELDVYTFEDWKAEHPELVKKEL